MYPRGVELGDEYRAYVCGAECDQRSDSVCEIARGTLPAGLRSRVRVSTQAKQPMTMLPLREKKRQFCARIDKVNLGFRGLLIADQANPVLLEQQEIESEMDNIAGFTPVETHDIYGWKRGGKLIK